MTEVSSPLLRSVTYPALASPGTPSARPPHPYLSVSTCPVSRTREIPTEQDPMQNENAGPFVHKEFQDRNDRTLDQG